MATASQRCALAADGGGRGVCLRGEKGWGLKNACKSRRIPAVRLHALLVCPTFGRLAATDQNHTFTDLILHAPQLFASLTFPTKPTLNYKNAKAKNLPKPLRKTDFAKKLLCQKRTWRNVSASSTTKARSKLTETFAENREADNRQMKSLTCQNFAENHETNFRNLRNFETKLFELKR